MNKEFIPYEQALILKELGFDDNCFAYYELGTLIYSNNPTQNKELICNCTTPLYQQAFRWFRENYNLNANIYKWHPDFAKSMGHLELEWEGSVTHFTEKKVGGSEYFKTYEEAELACLNKLIEIVKNK